MSDYTPIQCGHYDVLEIICMDSYDVEVITGNGKASGTASGIELRREGEYLTLSSLGSIDESIRLDQIKKINVLTRPCRFSTHDFA